MKKLSTKPISSPGRTDKFPPPLMRFLKSNAGNRSRGRSRTSPMFLRKKNTTAIETKEPSSPKVTCMGQVRVRRSSKQPTAKKGRHSSSSSVSNDGAPAPTKGCCWCWWVPHILFWNRKKPGSCCKSQSVRPNWGCFRRKEKALMKNGSNFIGRDNPHNESKPEEEEEEEEEDEELEWEEDRVNNANAFVSTTPPRNALLLTRCKSAPYSSSSLASRFWGSPLRNEETEQPSEIQRPGESKDIKLRFFKELDDSPRERINEREEKVNGMQKKEEAEGEGEGDSAARPLVLTRCKSERPRTAYVFD